MNQWRYPALSEVSIILNLLDQDDLLHQHFTDVLQLMLIKSHHQIAFKNNT